MPAEIRFWLVIAKSPCASCTAGRCNFITGQLPIRVGVTTVGQAGATVGMPDQCVTTATALKSQGYATGQFGKNHLGDLNRYLPTLHGFDEGPSKRHELFYFGGATLGAVRLDEMKFTFIQQPTGWPGPKISTDMPSLVNLRQDPFERYPMISGESALTGAFGCGRCADRSGIEHGAAIFNRGTIAEHLQ